MAKEKKNSGIWNVMVVNLPGVNLHIADLWEAILPFSVCVYLNYSIRKEFQLK